MQPMMAQLSQLNNLFHGRTTSVLLRIVKEFIIFYLSVQISEKFIKQLYKPYCKLILCTLTCCNVFLLPLFHAF